MANTRDQIIQTTCELLEKQGYHATGLNEIVKESGAPKGSIYYYFPGGKEEITAEAVLFSGRTAAERVRAHLAAARDPAEAVQAFVETIARAVEESGFQAGGPLTIVAAETATSSERLNAACREAYGLLEDAFRSRLLAGGLEAERAASLAKTILAAVEGGVILSRTYHSGDPLRAAAGHLGHLIRNCE